jgi:hypothetical protein
MCVATNPVGSADLEFNVDVISKPGVAQSIKNTIEVIVGEAADIRCPILDRRDPGEIMWMRERRPIDDDDAHKYIISHSGMKFHLVRCVIVCLFL